MNLIVIGGGIGGLCTVYALQQQGLDVHVYDAASSFKPIGAGIGIGSNAMQALVKLGIGEAIQQNGTILKTQLFLNKKGTILNSIDFSSFQKRFGQSNITIQRADLHQALYDQLLPHTLHLHKRCIQVEQLEDGCIVHFEDGTTVTCDYVIAADGLHSPIRQQYVPNSKPRYAGYMCWRGVAKAGDLVQPHTSVEIWDSIGRFGYAPIKDGQVYWFACVNAREQDPFLHHLEKEQIAYLFKDFPQPIAELIRQTDQELILTHDLYDLKPIQTYHFNRCILLGDAAHATTPNMGQGAGQAIEDALVFSQALHDFKDFQQAATYYNQKRHAKTKKVTTLSRKIGWAAQWENPLLTKSRDFVFPFIPSALLLKRLDFLFKD